ncbi:related to MRPL51 - mitochondrial ribosomal protein, large subunit [Ustilago sp. UG-2017b]|nr:related to MRPL51 - mitochondrial ribosomal protein, large subunit [Ustilago sp. UG-2017b]
MSHLKQITQLLRGSLSTAPSSPAAGAPGSFHLPVRKLVLRYSQYNPSSSGLRAFLLSPRFSALSSRYPSIEFVVSEAGSEKHPLVTGFYRSTLKDASKAGGERRKDINLANLDANQVEQKLRHVVESSGAKTKALKRRPVESKSEGARGIWSQLHSKPVDI